MVILMQKEISKVAEVFTTRMINGNVAVCNKYADDYLFRARVFVCVRWCVVLSPMRRWLSLRRQSVMRKAAPDSRDIAFT